MHADLYNVSEIPGTKNSYRQKDRQTNGKTDMYIRWKDNHTKIIRIRTKIAAMIIYMYLHSLSMSVP